MAVVKDAGVGCIYCPLMSGFDLYPAFSVCTPGPQQCWWKPGLGDRKKRGCCWVIGVGVGVGAGGD